MNRIAVIATFFAATLTATVNASAQDHRVNVNVPFNFTVGSKTLPAGAYAVRSTGPDPYLMTFTNWDKQLGVIAMGQPDQNRSNHSSALVFHKYGDQYFLSEIRSATSSTSIRFVPTKAEKRARAYSENAGLRVQDPVLIALNNQ